MRDRIEGSSEPEHSELLTNTLLQRGFLTAVAEHLPDDMYSRIEYGHVDRDRDNAVLNPHSRLTTNTYFGRLPASYWQRWTAVTEIDMTAVVSGTGRVHVMASDSAGVPRTVSAYVVSGPEPVPIRLTAHIDRFLDGGALWIEATSGPEPLRLDAVRWHGPAAERTRPGAVVICTHNRVDACLDTLERMNSDPAAMWFVDTVYVVDQGTETVAAEERFADVERSFGTKLRYTTQANLGGAGGFTRGMVEAIDQAKSPEHANIVLMDDDIILEPDTLIRVFAFADRTTSPVLVGGQMLCALHPQQLIADAEDFDPDTLRVGLPVTRSLAKANMLRKRQEIRVDAPYNAWWTCLIPGEVVTRVGHPLPVFFQWDDVEFGIRARENGIATVTLPGAGVWHTDTHWKNWDDWSRYFHFRNGLLVSALHSGFDTGKIVRNLAWEMSCCLVSMQYGLTATMIKAVEDFLRGPEAFADGGVEVAAEVHKFRAEYPETAVQAAADVHWDTDAPLVRDPGKPSMPLAILIKRTVWQLLNRTRPSAAVHARDAHWWHLAMFRSAVVTDVSQQGVRVYRMDRELARRLAWRAGRALWRLRREGTTVRQEYLAAMPEMTSRSNWQRLFDG